MGVTNRGEACAELFEVVWAYPVDATRGIDSDNKSDR
jgi:hypothetical protein